MKNWRVLSLVLVFVAAALVWHVLPVPTATAQMKLPPGVTLTSKEFGTQGIPGVKKVTFNRLQVNRGAKWADVVMGAKTWDFCYELQGTMSVKDAKGKVSQVKPGTSYTIAPEVKIPLIFNTGKVPAVDIFWEIELQ